MTMLAGVLLGVALAGAPQTRVVAVDGNPEGVISYGDLVFASNLGANRSPALDGDGYISKLTVTGELLAKRFLPHPDDGVLNSPTGMVIVSDVLYVADLGRVVGFAVATGRKVFEVEAPDADVGFLNDVAFLGGNLLAVSATDVKRLYVLDYRTKAWRRVAADHAFGHVNGLAVDRDQHLLYVAENEVQTLRDGNGKLTAFDVSGADLVLRWETGFGRFLDGVTRLGTGTLLVSDWSDFTGGGVIHVVDARSGAHVRADHWGQRGLADFHYDRYLDVLVLPAMLTGNVHLVTGAFPPATTRACTSREPSGFGAVALSQDEFGIVRQVSFDDQACRIGEYSRSDTHVWFQGLPRDCGLNATLKILEVGVAHDETRGTLSVEVRFEREPDTDCPGGRMCDPSPVGYQYFWCR